MASGKKIRMAIVGCGGIGRGHHMPNFTKDDRVEFVVACDLVERRAQRVAEEFGIPNVETDYRKALTEYDLDAVTVCTSNDAHAPVSILAAEQGLHVMCEKPMALDLDEAKAMLDAVEKAGVVHMVDFSKRFPAHSRLVKKLLDEGVLGRIYSIAVDYYQGYRGNPDCPMAWRIRKAMAGSGVLGDLGSHGLDLVRFWIGEIATVNSYIRNLIDERPGDDGQGREAVDCDDLAFVMGLTANDVPYSLRTTWNRSGTGDDLTAEIHGEKGTLMWKMHSPTYVRLIHSSGGWGNGEFEDMEIPGELDVNPFRIFIDHCVSGIPMPASEPSFVDGFKVQGILQAAIDGSCPGKRLP